MNKTTIRGFAGTGILFAPTNASGASAYLEVQEATVANNPGGGIRVIPASPIFAHASLTRVNLNRNLFGLRADDRGIATISYSTVAANTNNGVVAVASVTNARINLVNCTVSGNGVSGVATSGSNAAIRLLNTAAIENTIDLSISGAGAVAGTTPDTNLIGSSAVTANQGLQ